MEPFIKAYLNRLEELHQDIEAAIAELPAAAFDWSPGEGFNTISVLIVHLTGSERYWIGDVACSLPSNRDREAEFHAQGWTLTALQKRLKDTLDFAATSLSQFTLEDLGRVYTSSRGNQVTAAWAILHALEHTAIHLGHIQITRQWWEKGQ